MPTKTRTKTPTARRSGKAAPDSPDSRRKAVAEGNGGTYVYDKAQGKLVKVSDRVPKVASKRGGGAPAPFMEGCGRGGRGGGCGGGACGS